MIYGCVCCECGNWHSHCYPHPKNRMRFICVDCLKKIDMEKRGVRK